MNSEFQIGNIPESHASKICRACSDCTPILSKRVRVVMPPSHREPKEEGWAQHARVTKASFFDAEQFPGSSSLWIRETARLGSKPSVVIKNSTHSLAQKRQRARRDTSRASFLDNHARNAHIGAESGCKAAPTRPWWNIPQSFEPWPGRH